MPCCGSRRTRAVAAIPQKAEPVAITHASPVPVVFEYTGKTSLAVVGPITRTTYRFPSPGAKVPVSAGDARAISGIPNLRRAPN